MSIVYEIENKIFSIELLEVSNNIGFYSMSELRKYSFSIYHQILSKVYNTKNIAKQSCTALRLHIKSDSKVFLKQTKKCP